MTHPDNRPAHRAGPRHPLALVAAAALAAGLSACGGGGDDPVAATPAPMAPVVPASQVPAAATQSADAAFEFVAGLARRNEDTAEPIVVGDAMLATSDTIDARPL